MNTRMKIISAFPGIELTIFQSLAENSASAFRNRLKKYIFQHKYIHRKNGAFDLYCVIKGRACIELRGKFAV